MAIILVGIGAGAVHSSFKPVMLRLEDSKPQPPATTTPQAPEPRTQQPPGSTPNTTVPVVDAAPKAVDPETLGTHLSLAEAKSLFDQGYAFVDAREDHERDQGWISGSVHLTTGMLTGAKLPDQFNSLDAGAHTVIYCAGGTCAASENLAVLLKQAGFAHLHIFIDGFPAWKAAGYPIETAPAEDKR